MHNELLSDCVVLGCRSHSLRSHNLVLQKCSALPRQDFAETFALGDFCRLTDGHNNVDVARYTALRLTPTFTRSRIESGRFSVRSVALQMTVTHVQSREGLQHPFTVSTQMVYFPGCRPNPPPRKKHQAVRKHELDLLGRKRF